MRARHARRGKHLVEKIVDLVLGKRSDIGIFILSVHQSHATKMDRLRARTKMPARGWRRVLVNAGCACMPGENCAAIQFFLPPSSCFENRAEPLLDVGCGVGLLAFYLRERNFLPPISGLDRDGRKIDARQRGEERRLSTISISSNRMSAIRLHKLATSCFSISCITSGLTNRRACSRGSRRASRPAACSVIRDCPRDGNARFWLTHLAERFAQSDDLEHESAAPFSDPRENLCRFRPGAVLPHRRARSGGARRSTITSLFSAGAGRSCSGRGRMQR